MREASTDLLVDLPGSYSTSQLLLDRLARGGPAPVYTVKRGTAWIEVSAADYLDTVRSVAKSLIEAGVRPGDSVAIMSGTRYEWAVAEQAIWFAGAVSVPVYETSSAYQAEWILRDSGARYAFAENASRAAVVRAAAAVLDAPVTVWTFDDVWSADDGSPSDVDTELSLGTVPSMNTVPPLDTVPSAGLAELAAAGRASGVTDAEVEQARASRGLADPATIVYTSGTTGRPKGCVMTHANFCLVAANLALHLPQIVGPSTSNLMFLPLAHVLARAVQHACLHAGTTVSHTPGSATLLEDLATVQPTFLLAVPRIFEKLRAGALAKAEAAGKGKLFAQAEAVAIAVSKDRDARARGQRVRPSPVQALKHLAFDRLVYPKLRAVLGGHVRYTVSGASALNPELAHFFRGAGLSLLEGYGLTETTAPATVNLPGNTRVGSVGLPIPGTTVRIAEDGEILVKGIGLFAGYHNNPQATAQAFEDGFFKTGDLGSLDKDGFLTITGRKKDLLVTAGGKNVAPGPLEEIVRASRLVSHAVVVGEGRPFVSALVTLDPEELGRWARHKGLPALTAEQAAVHPAVLAEVQAAVDAANATVSAAEGIRKFMVLADDFTEESGHLTPSLKLKRTAVFESHAAQIARLYAR